MKYAAARPGNALFSPLRIAKITGLFWVDYLQIGNNLGSSPFLFKNRAVKSTW